MTDTNRETWLARALPEIAPMFKDVGEMPQMIHVSCGFPSKMALSTRKRRIGECWHPRVSADGAPHIFISPVLSDGVKVLGVLVHEVIHAVIGTEHGHKAPFKSAMGKVGLIGKATATDESPELIERLNKLLNKLGPYPQPAFNAVALQKELDKTKQTTRLLKATCANGDEAEEGKPYTVRITRLHLDRFGAPICPECLKRMNVEGWEPDDLDEQEGK